MAVNLGTTPIANIYIGNTQIQNVYLGNALVYSASNPFTFTVNTANTSTGSSSANQFRLPLISSFNGITSTVDWGDGSTDTITAFDEAAVTHTYSISGTYTIKITEAMRGWQFSNSGDKLKMLNISNCGIFELELQSFWGCTNLTGSFTDIFLVNTNSLRLAFAFCNSFNGNLQNLNVSGVINVDQMLRDCDAYNTSLANWDINQITTFNNFMLSATGLSTANYDATLISWNNQVPLTGKSISFGGSKFTLGGAAASARASLISTYGWTIVDGGGI